MRMDGQEPGKAPEIFGIAAMLMGRDRAQQRPVFRLGRRACCHKRLGKMRCGQLGGDPLGKKKILSERLRKPSS